MERIATNHTVEWTSEIGRRRSLNQRWMNVIVVDGGVVVQPQDSPRDISYTVHSRFWKQWTKSACSERAVAVRSGNRQSVKLDSSSVPGYTITSGQTHLSTTQGKWKDSPFIHKVYYICISRADALPRDALPRDVARLWKTLHTRLITVFRRRII